MNATSQVYYINHIYINDKLPSLSKKSNACIFTDVVYVVKPPPPPKKNNAASKASVA